MSAKAEYCYPYVIGLLVAGLYFWFFRTNVVPERISALFETTVTISSIAIGFLITTKSILFSIQDGYIIKELKKAKKYNLLLDYIMAGVHWNFFLAIFSGGLLLLDFKHQECWYFYVVGTWIFLGIVALLTSYRVIHLFAKILKVQPPQK